MFVDKNSDILSTEPVLLTTEISMLIPHRTVKALKGTREKDFFSSLTLNNKQSKAQKNDTNAILRFFLRNPKKVTFGNVTFNRGIKTIIQIYKNIIPSVIFCFPSKADGFAISFAFTL